ncbi:hypothetical protein LTR53_012380 [Teratosphaeriaceae sp. CCFEE 6253]|nr:hypothetical protein LTR53_012380 [Teratosphaeriaceae sp. CCFEE 6253]
MRLIIFCLTLLATVSAKCFDPSPAFPVPSWTGSSSHSLQPAFHRIATALDQLAQDPQYDTTSFSLSLTSPTRTLFTHHHTARRHNATRPGDTAISSRSRYRIASITKTFTTLALLHQHAAGNLSLDDAVSTHIPELAGAVPWHAITLRQLASQLSGLPREIAQADLLNALSDPTKFGLPPVNQDDEDLDLPECYEYRDYQPCNWTDLLPHVSRTAKPIFAPGQASTYSNANFELLGLVLERATNTTFSGLMHRSIFEPLGMNSTTLHAPTSDEHAVLPVGQFFWDVDEGVHNPTGGIYSSSEDMMRYARYVLTHYNALATGVNWFLPASWSGGNLGTFYGMPWEILRTTDLLPESERPVTLVTKSGGVPMYFSRLTFLPEYGLAAMILVGGSSGILDKIQDIVIMNLVPEAEAQCWAGFEGTYTGAYAAAQSTRLNSSLTLAASPSKGLQLTSFVSNGTDVFATLLAIYADALGLANSSWRVQLTPTLLFKNETSKQGEIWRMLVVSDREEGGKKRGVWGEDFCLTDVDPNSYAGLPLNEAVFWHERGVLELPAWRVELAKIQSEELVVQV